VWFPFFRSKMFTPFKLFFFTKTILRITIFDSWTTTLFILRWHSPIGSFYCKIYVLKNSSKQKYKAGTMVFLSCLTVRAGATLQWDFIRLSKDYHHCGPSSGSRHQRPNLPDTRRITQRWQSVGPVLIGKAGRKKKYIYIYFGWLIQHQVLFENIKK
jgi:hypothetical protein